MTKEEVIKEFNEKSDYVTIHNLDEGELEVASYVNSYDFVNIPKAKQNITIYKCVIREIEDAMRIIENRGRLKVGETYGCLDDDLNVVSYEETGMGFDSDNYYQDNYYHTKEETEEMLKKLKNI